MRSEEVKVWQRSFNDFIERISQQVYHETIELKASVNLCGERQSFEQASQGDFKHVGIGEVWGHTLEYAWFRVTGVIPPEWKGKTVAAQLDLNCEALLCDEKGKPIVGITSGSIFERGFKRSHFPVTDVAEGKEKLELNIEAVSMQFGGLAPEAGPGSQNDGKHTGVVKKLFLSVFDKDLWHLWMDLKALTMFLEHSDAETVRGRRIIRAIKTAIIKYADNPDNAAAARDSLRPVFEKQANASALTTTAVGHGHLDVGFLWPVQEGLRKAERTFISQLKMLEEYPDYIFGASQPVLYEHVKHAQPEVFEIVRRRIAEGRWECQGGMWTEADCNMPSGESLVRQFVYGKHFYLDEFGVDVKTSWLPDTFGFTGALPQIFQKSGCPYFMSQKMSWNEFNTFPHHSFLWRGVDGTNVLTHFLPEHGYGSWLLANCLLRAERLFAEKDFLDEFLTCYGCGDGGMGPSRRHIEYGQRHQNFEGMPKVKFGTSESFFERLQERQSELEIWDGELYLEFHRGTYTSQAQMKKYNREFERRLHAAEYLWTALAPETYPKNKVDKIWKTTLTNQFHDIMTGSSVNQVYEESRIVCAETAELLDQVECAAADGWTDSDTFALTLVNVLSTPWSGVVELPTDWKGAEHSPTVNAVQRENGKLFAAVSLPPQGIEVLRNSASAETVENLTNPILENDLIRYEFNESGHLIRSYDKELDMEWIAEGECGNALVLYEDRPSNFDAWEVELNTLEMELEQAVAAGQWSGTAGPVQSSLTFTLKVGKSEIRQTISLAAKDRLLTFRTGVEWKEDHRLLRVRFVTDVRRGIGSFDSAYCRVERQVHNNTGYDLAQFETPGQRYADLSNRDFGVALLNDCKYGYSVKDNVIGLSLLRAPAHPDPQADRGYHEFTYALYPHAGACVEGGVIERAAAFNQGITRLPGKRIDTVLPPVLLESEAVSLEAVKKAEKSDDLIIRLVETHGRHSTAVLKLNRSGVLRETNLIETEDGETVDPNRPLKLKPYEIKTLRLS